ncbi:hypothetical protein O7614_26520 [Micromonospora sp. WMMD961]|uniref:hypothetical protein n=1 Tax=Micromonospora sp. WMMD961 TaxID=3016100 RepID=UPI0024162901|nr:hypothetical protein [Micromonospora sp. WMMD961]MDG4783219.1 hypothetical protein [Micromonospora sp. WMMD961]
MSDPDYIAYGWQLAQLAGVEKAASVAAARVTRDRGGVVEYDDMRQEALIWVATHANSVSQYIVIVDGAFVVDIALLAHRLYSRLLNLSESEAGRAVKTYSYAATREGADE